VKTISTYRTRLMEKLGVRNTADLVRYAIEHQLFDQSRV
jgi:two-component system invasion response regulator UvrY